MSNPTLLTRHNAPATLEADPAATATSLKPSKTLTHKNYVRSTCLTVVLMVGCKNQCFLRLGALSHWGCGINVKQPQHNNFTGTHPSNSGITKSKGRGSIQHYREYSKFRANLGYMRPFSKCKKGW